MKNYWDNDQFTIFTKPFIYLDVYTDDGIYLADRLFAERRIRMKFDKKELIIKNAPYRIIFCKVNKKDVEKFKEAMEKLKDKILLMGYKEYEEYCDTINKRLEEITN